MPKIDDRQIDLLHRQHRDPEQAIGVGLAIIGEPTIVGAAHPGGEAGVFHRAGEKAEARIQESGIDAVGIHVDDACVRVEPALLAFGIFEAVELDGALPDADSAEAANSPRIAQQLAFDAEALLAVVVDDKPRPALAELGLDIFVPETERLENVAIGIDDVVGPRHD